MKQIENFSDLAAKLETCQAMMILFIDPVIFLPSQSLLKYYSQRSPVAKELENHIFVYKGTEAKMFQFFNVLCFPQVTIIKQKPNNVLYNFIGSNREKAWQALGVLALALGRDKPTKKLQNKYRNCPKQHELKLQNQITDASYRNGLFLCNACNMFSHVEVDRPILHCSPCEYDICNECAFFETIK